MNRLETGRVGTKYALTGRVGTKCALCGTKTIPNNIHISVPRRPSRVACRLTILSLSIRGCQNTCGRLGSSAESTCAGKKKINHIYAMAFQSSCAHVKSRDDQLHSGVPSIEQTYLVVNQWSLIFMHQHLKPSSCTADQANVCPLKRCIVNQWSLIFMHQHVLKPSSCTADQANVCPLKRCIVQSNFVPFPCIELWMHDLEFRTPGFARRRNYGHEFLQCCTRNAFQF